MADTCLNCKTDLRHGERSFDDGLCYACWLKKCREVKTSDCEKCGRWIGGLAGECYFCSRLGAVPKSERPTFCPFFYHDKRKLVG